MTFNIPPYLFKARISVQVAFAVLFAVLIIETIVVVPSYTLRRQILFDDLEQMGKMTLIPFAHLVETGDVMVSRQTTLAGDFIQNTVVLGAILYQRDGQELFRVGEQPALSFQRWLNGQQRILSPDGLAYDVAWTSDELGVDYHLIVRLDASGVQRKIRAYAIRTLGIVFAVTAFISFVILWAVSSTVLVPLLNLRQHLLTFGTDKPSLLPIDLAANKHRNEFDDVLAEQIADRTADLENTAHELLTANEQLQTLNKRLQQDLLLARDIQQGLLPPTTPVWDGPRTHCFNEPAQEVGGDFYTYTDFGNQRYGVAIGDVSGKGMPAALMMAVSVAAYQGVVQQPRPPEQVLQRLTHALRPHTKATHQNCAFIYADLLAEPKTDEVQVTIANAGCVAPIIKYADGRVQWLDVGGVPLGIGLSLDFSYQSVTLKLSKGDFIILTSDGVVEANDVEGQIFGFDRLETVVETAPTLNAPELVTYLSTQITEFAGSAAQHDDMTIVVIEI